VHKRGIYRFLFKYRGSSVLDDKNRGKKKNNDYNKGKCGKLIEQLLSTFSVPSQDPFFGVKLLYDYGFRGFGVYSINKTGGRRKMFI
jgi:hypothetical protein